MTGHAPGTGAAADVTACAADGGRIDETTRTKDGLMKGSAAGRAKKSLGQNFLVSERAIRKIVEALRPGEGLPVFEIGPGRGALTIPLAEKGSRIAAFEIDRELAPLLRDACARWPLVEIVEADIRDVDFDAEAEKRGWQRYRIAGNIPYLLTSTILLRLPFSRGCAGAVIMVQKEVGERILASPGERNCGILTVFLRAYLGISEVAKVKAGSFVPPPKIDSVVLDFRPEKKEGAPAGPDEFLSFVKRGFSQRRKKLLNVLRDGRGPEGRSAAEEAFAAAGVNVSKRPEELDLDEWFRLFGIFRQTGGEGQSPV